MQAEIARLQEQNSRLCSLLEAERRNSKKARDELVKKVSSLLVDFSDERDRTLREAVYGVKENNERAIEQISERSDEHSEVVDTAMSRGKAFGEALDEMVDEKEDAIGKSVSVSSNPYQSRDNVTDVYNRAYKQLELLSKTALRRFTTRRRCH